MTGRGGGKVRHTNTHTRTRAHTPWDCAASTELHYSVPIQRCASVRCRVDGCREQPLAPSLVAKLLREVDRGRPHLVAVAESSTASERIPHLYFRTRSFPPCDWKLVAEVALTCTPPKRSHLGMSTEIGHKRHGRHGTGPPINRLPSSSEESELRAKSPRAPSASANFSSA